MWANIGGLRSKIKRVSDIGRIGHDYGTSKVDSNRIFSNEKEDVLRFRKFLSMKAIRKIDHQSYSPDLTF